eukprot:2407803-Amphidinium_carterae.1
MSACNSVPILKPARQCEGRAGQGVSPPFLWANLAYKSACKTDCPAPAASPLWPPLPVDTTLATDYKTDS